MRWWSNGVAVTFCVVTVIALSPAYFHLLVWKKPTALPLSSFGLQDSNKDNQLIFQSHLSMEDATAAVNGLLKRTETIKPLLMTTELKKDKFTILMPSYKRTETLPSIFDHYCVMADIIDQLVIVWNNIGEPVPEELLSYKCGLTITFLEQEKNTLNNRFIPFPEIKTECILSLDDDRVIAKEALVHGFEMWKTFPQLLVGYIARVHGYNDITHSYFYRVQGVTTAQPYSIALTIAAFMHHRYLEEYTKNLPKEAKEFVNRNINCEDLFMVATISQFLKKNDQPQCACMWIDEVAADLENARVGLSSDRSHYTERDECLNLMVKLFDKFPLHHCSLYIGKKDL